MTNLILDPIFIFGWFGFPALGLKGAAIATVIGRAGTMVASLLILHFRERLVEFCLPRLREVFQSWKTMGAIAVPATFTNLLEPVALGVITRLIADYGAGAVAAWGAGSRVSAFVLIPVFGVCSGLVPFIGQNWGTELFGRVSKARNYAYLSAVVWGVALIGLLHLAAGTRRAGVQRRCGRREGDCGVPLDRAHRVCDGRNFERNRGDPERHR